MILSIGRVVKVVAAFFVQDPGMFYAVSREVSGVVAPSALSVETVLGVVPRFAAAIAFNVTGVRVFSDHVLALVGRSVGLGLSG